MNSIEKVMKEISSKDSSYVIINVTKDGISYTSDFGKRRSTRTLKISDKEITLSEKVLKSFDEKTILFAKAIKKIEFTLLDGRYAYFERRDEKEYSYIKAKKATETNPKEYTYFKTETSGASIAFAIKYRKDGRKQIDVCDGAIMNGIFATNLETDIQFLFSTELNLKNKISTEDLLSSHRDILNNLIAVYRKALISMAAGPLVGMSLYECLPCGLDDIEATLDSALITAHTDIFAEKHMFRSQPTKDGSRRIVLKSTIVMGTPEVMDLFPPVLFEKVFSNSRYWIEDYLPGSRAEFFLQNMNITWYDRERFITELFSSVYANALQDLLAEQNDKWLRKFYIFCAKEVHEQTAKIRLIAGFKNICSIRDSKGKMQYPNKVTIPNGDNVAFKNASILKENILRPGDKDDEYTELLINFFRNEIGIGYFSVKNEIEQMAKDMEAQKPTINEKFCNSMLQMAMFDKSNPGEIDFKKYTIFPYEGNRGVSRGKAKDILIGKPYIKEGDLLSRAMNKPCLWKGFGKFLSATELEVLLEFIERCGALGKPKIVMVPAAFNVDYEKQLKAEGKRTYRDTDYDYTIPYLDELLKKQSLQISKLVWEAILQIENPEKVLYAEYSCDNRGTVNRCDSTLIQILRQRTWVPNEENKCFKPEDIMIKDIKTDFIYKSRNAVLKQLSFGSVYKKKDQDRKNLEKLAKSEGFALIPLEDFDDYLTWKSSKKNNRKRKK